MISPMNRVLNGANLYVTGAEHGSGKSVPDTAPVYPVPEEPALAGDAP